jgi:hypothetical protein
MIDCYNKRNPNILSFYNSYHIWNRIIYKTW